MIDAYRVVSVLLPTHNLAGVISNPNLYFFYAPVFSRKYNIDLLIGWFHESRILNYDFFSSNFCGKNFVKTCGELLTLPAEKFGGSDLWL